MVNKVIPIKHGTLTNSIEAYADLENGEVEDVSWDEGPSNEFYAASGTIMSMSTNENYRANYDKIFRHDEEEDDNGEEQDD